MNLKGGVGKTTTASNMAYELARLGYKTLAVDLDPQGHLTDGYGIKNFTGPGSLEVLRHGEQAGAVYRGVRENLFLVGANFSTGGATLQALSLAPGPQALGKWLALNADRFDFTVMDCPPTLDNCSASALLAAHELIIPVTGDYLSLQGVAAFSRVIRAAEKLRSNGLKRWLLMTRFQPQRKLAQEVKNKISDNFPGELLHTEIRENVALAESPGFGLSIFEYASASTGARDYGAMVREFLDRSENARINDDINEGEFAGVAAHAC